MRWSFPNDNQREVFTRAACRFRSLTLPLEDFAILHPVARHGAEKGGVADDCDALGFVPPEPIFEMFDALLEGLDGLASGRHRRLIRRARDGGR